MLIAGIALQGLWSTEDGGQTWARLGQGPGSATITNRPTSIVYDPQNPNRYWESGIYNGGGAYVTQDDGTTFAQLGDLYHTDYVSVDLSDPMRRTMLSGRHEGSQLFRSTDGGATWADLTTRLPPGIGFTTSPRVLSSTDFLLGTASASGSGIFRSADAGETWTRVYQGGIAGTPLVARADGAMYWLLSDGHGLIRSTDQGQTWVHVVGSGHISPNATDLLELPDGHLATLGIDVVILPDGSLSTSGSLVIASADHGVSWRPISPPLPYVPSGLVYSPYRQAFYAWHFDCLLDRPDPVKPDAILKFPYP